MGIQAQAYVKESQEVIQALQNEKVKCGKVEVCQYDKYISDNQDNRIFMKQMLGTDGSKLIVANPGAGKSTALIDTAHRFLKKKRQTKVIIVAPTRGLAEQMGNAKGVSCVIGGVDYNKKNKLISTTYDKLNCLFETLEIEKNKNDYRYVLIADEAHLMVTQADWKKYPIKNLLSYLKGNLFSTSLFITATPEPLTAFNFNQIIEFKSKDKAPSIEKVEIILADDGLEYLKQRPFDKEFLFVRLCNKSYMQKFIKENPNIKVETLTADDKNSTLYKDIVENSLLEKNDRDMIFTTNLLEAGVSICEYPPETVPIALFMDNNISTDNIIQFLNRLRRTENNHVKTARVVLKKAKEREIHVCLMKENDVLIEFQEYHFHMGSLIVEDTLLMNRIDDGTYKLKVTMGKSIEYREVRVVSAGTTSHGTYAKDEAQLVFENISFKSLIYLLVANKERIERLQINIQQKMDALFAVHETMTEQEKKQDEKLLANMAKGAIDDAGEFKICLSYEDREIKIDNNIFFMLTYEQFQRQYSNPLNVDILQKELADKMDTVVEVKTVTTEKQKQEAICNKEIWEGLESLKEELPYVDSFYDAIMGTGTQVYYHNEKWQDIIAEFRKQQHLMDLLNDLFKADIKGGTALKILIVSKTKGDVTRYKNLSKVIWNNRFLERIGSSDIADISFVNESARNRLQAVCYCYLKKKGNKNSYTVNQKLILEIMEEYEKCFPKSKKLPTKREVKSMIKRMYKMKEKRTTIFIIEARLRTNLNDIFDMK